MSQKSTRDLFARAKASEKSLRWLANQIPEDVTTDTSSESKMLNIIKLYSTNAADCLAELTNTNIGNAKTRAENELYALETKWTALRDFALSENFCKLKKKSRDLLVKQFEIMTAYKLVLKERLSDWEE